MKVVKGTNQKTLAKAVSVLRKGGIVFAPTDTIYGLLADATDQDAVNRLYQIRRPSGRPFIILLPDTDWLHTLDLYADEKTLSLLDLHITVIFYKRTTYPLHLTRGRKSLAFRLPPEKTFIRELLELFGRPLVAPSANPEGLPPAVDVKMAQEYFGDQIDLYIDAGTIEGKPSTIVRVIGKKGIRLVREGSVEFEKVLKFARENL